MTSLPPTIYRTQLTKQRHPDGTDPASLAGDAWQAGPDLELDMTESPDSSTPDQTVSLGGSELSIAQFTTAAGDVLHMSFVVTDADLTCDLDGDSYLAGAITFSTFGDGFAGTVTSICSDRSGTGSYLWKGAVADPAAFVRRTPLAATLSLTELAGLVPEESTHDAASQLLVESMRWALAQSSDTAGWLSSFFGVIARDLDADRQALVRQDLEWYQKSFAIAYLASGFNALPSDQPPELRLNAAQSRKLQNYLTKGLGSSAPYARQMGGMYVAAHLQAKPRLSAYLADGTKWADALLAFLRTPGLLGNDYNGARETPPDLRLITANATLLHILDPTAARAKEYVRSILAFALLNISLQTVIRDAGKAMVWLPSALQSFAGTSNGAAIVHAATQLGGYDALAREIAAAFAGASGHLFFSQVAAATSAFTAKHPDLADAARAFFFLAWAGGIHSVAAAYVNAASPAASVMAECIALVTMVSESVPAIFGPPASAADYERIVEACENVRVLDAFGRIASKLVGEDEDWTDVGALALGELLDADLKVIRTQGTPWIDLVNDSAKLLGGITAISALGYTITGTVIFINDLRSGQPISKQALDGIAASSYFMATVCGILGISYASAALGTAASAFAYLGAAAVLISVFIPARKPESKPDQFMRETAIPFINALSDPA